MIKLKRLEERINFIILELSDEDSLIKNDTMLIFKDKNFNELAIGKFETELSKDKKHIKRVIYKLKTFDGIPIYSKIIKEVNIRIGFGKYTLSDNDIKFYEDMSIMAINKLKDDFIDFKYVFRRESDFEYNVLKSLASFIDKYYPMRNNMMLDEDLLFDEYYKYIENNKLIEFFIKSKLSKMELKHCFRRHCCKNISEIKGLIDDMEFVTIKEV